MLFMNTWEIDEAVQKYAKHPVKGPATSILASLRNWTDNNSDGWCYWPKPCRAARQLQELILEKDESKVTPDRLKKALAPIKAFCTRHTDKGLSFERLQPQEA